MLSRDSYLDNWTYSWWTARPPPLRQPNISKDSSKNISRIFQKTHPSLISKGTLDHLVTACEVTWTQKYSCFIQSVHHCIKSSTIKKHIAVAFTPQKRTRSATIRQFCGICQNRQTYLSIGIERQGCATNGALNPILADPRQFCMKQSWGTQTC